MTEIDFSLSDKVALVTGARRGIGRAIALAFAGAGADVAICDIVVDDGQLNSTVQEIQKLGRKALAIHADVSKRDDIENVTQNVMAEFGKIDILVNNAGTIARGSLLELDEDEWDRIVNTNLKGCFLCCKAVANHMIGQNNGSIINIASVAGIAAAVGARTIDITETSPYACAYLAAKSGLIMLTKRLAWELASFNIRVNSIAPGNVMTEFTSVKWENTEEVYRQSSSVPLRRVAQPSDIAGAAVFLASKAASYITAQTIVVDGGLLA